MSGSARSRRARFGAAVLLAALLAACAAGTPPPSRLAGEGVASWYGDDFHGRTTSSGDRYNMYRLTAASRDLPLGTRLRVTRLDTGKSVTVLVNDRGPFVAGRILDLSYEAARRLEMLETGVATVRLEILSSPAASASRPAAAVPIPSAQASGGWWVSLGAFTLEKNALWLRDRVAPRLPGVAVVRQGSGDSSLYQVRVGPHQGPEAAERTRRLLEELGLRGSAGREQTP